ncbi:hypothetical protein ACFC1T_29955 [Kitasatospora sp. NPDC056076]|uniref:hypothetical protein n=1 Tax=Kitasatospora sp. NPDC056076 TaxID=3345703 RepID=UPI0035E05108
MAPGAAPRAAQSVGSGGASFVQSPPPAAHRSMPGTAQVLQRVAEQAGLVGVPLTAVPARRPTSVQAAPSSTGQPGGQRPPGGAGTGSTGKGATAAEDPDKPDHTAPGDLDELARRLVEPVGRLLRTELRRGRERAGKPYDLRR